ncbi:MAG TPA: DNA alkylation repair protein [Acidimicrobiales bacterium]|jgi:3-methyladenine DNA glycosylase AlkD|nr:DNA alkylation repair protein [Acidimicrobiales bacterium]
MGDPVAVGDFIHSGLAKVADPDRADKERVYLKSELVFLGVGVPATRQLVRESWRQNGGLDHDGLIAAADRLWGSDIHEHRMAAVELLKLAPPGALGIDDRAMLEHLLRTARTWAYVDSLAADVVGTLVVSSPKAWSPVLDQWALDEDFWIRRTALLSLLVPLRQGGGDFGRFSRYADAMLDEREFFIRKAIGWILRDTSRRRPELVADWIEPRVARASGVTVREAVKHLEPERRDRIMEAYASSH